MALNPATVFKTTSYIEFKKSYTILNKVYFSSGQRMFPAMFAKGSLVLMPSFSHRQELVTHNSKNN